MTKIRHYDPISKRWIIDGASNASNLELTNPGFLNEDGKSVSVDDGFTKLDNRVSKLEQNLAWIYLNGAKGGGGGSGGGGSAEYFIDLQYQSSVVYTTTGTVILDLLINSGGVSKTFKINVTGSNNVKYIQNKAQRSMTRFQLEISGITENTTLEISAQDTSGLMASPAYVDVIVGALYLNILGTPSKTIMLGGVNEASITFNVANKTGNNAKFLLFESDSNDPYGNGEIPIREQTIKLTEQNLNFSLKSLCQELSEGGVLIPGKTFRFKALAIQETLGLTTPYKTHNVTIVNSDTLLIVTEGITTSPEDPTSFVQGSFVQFNYFFSYNKTDYSDFAYNYKVFEVNGDYENEISQGSQSSGIVPNVVYTFGYNTSKLRESNPGTYYKIVITGFATADPQMNNSSSCYTHTVYFVLSPPDQSIMKARNYNNNLLAYFGAFHFPSDKTGNWVYELPSDDDYYAYHGLYKNKLSKVTLETYKVNGIDSGFITDSNSVRYIGLSKGSYAVIPIFKELLPTYKIEETMFNTGFCISTTFKAEDSADETETVLSLGNYANDDLSSGFEITLSQARIKIESIFESTVDLPKNQLLTIDLNVTPTTIIENSISKELYYFTIYVNGVMSACSRVDKAYINWLFGKSLYLGCREDLSHSSICKIYDFKIYTAPQSDVTMVQNYISAQEQAQLIKGEVNSSLDIELRNANMFIREKENGNGQGPCVLWDYANEQFKSGDALYQLLKEYTSQGELTYPIVYIQENTAEKSSFEMDCGAIWSEGDSDILNRQHPVTITITNSNGSCVIAKPDNVSDVQQGPRVAIQGTSSLSYMSKNLEIYAGTTDGTTPLLVSVDDSWLPENEFTLKADVVDSGHVNNTAIGRIINNLNILEETPPMKDERLWTENGVSKARAQEIMSKIKHTSDGFPCLVFVKFASDVTKFFGIYNFNLGRYAYYNLGLKILLDYDKPDGVSDGAPYVVSSYRELTNGYEGGTYSLEINKHNDYKQEAFEQADENTVRWMASCRYTSTDENQAYSKVVENLYTQLAEMTTTPVQKYYRTGITKDDIYQAKEGEFWGQNYVNYYTYDALGSKLNYVNAMTYYVVAMVFGMVDSMCKNLTLRSWGGTRWWTCFYDMDTAFKMNNSGSQIVKYWAHFHKYYNIIKDKDNITASGGVKQWASTDINDGFQQYFASTWSRLWEVLENIPSKSTSAQDEDPTSIGKIYWSLRTSQFADPKKFIEDHYKSYVKQCGPILYNYDYNIKYIAISKKYVNGELVDTTSSNQASFLHGTRADAVSDWFEKRIYFLDSVYSDYKPSVTQDSNIINIKSPLNGIWNANKAGNKTATDNIAKVTLSSKSKVKYAYNLGNEGFNYAWLDENPTEMIVKIPSGEKTVSFQGNNYITTFDNFKAFNWTKLDNIDFNELTALDLSGAVLNEIINEGNPLYDYASNIGLKNIRKLNLKGLKYTNSSSSVNLDVSTCARLEELDISNSSYTNVTLPKQGSALKVLNLSGINILELGTADANFGNQPSLETLDISNCNKLTQIHITNCESLKSLQIPSSVKVVRILNCNGLKSLRCVINSNQPYSNLEEFHIESCKGLEEIDLSNQNNPNLKVELFDCPSLQDLNLSNSSVTSETLFLDTSYENLKRLNLSNTKIKYLNYTQNQTAIDYIDLTHFEELSDLKVSECGYITKIVCTNNQDNPIELQSKAFYGCSNLKYLYGNFTICGSEVFRGCNSLVFGLDANQSFREGQEVLNLQFIPTLDSTLGMFQNCLQFNLDDFKYIMNILPESLTSLESMFNGCRNISGDLYRGLFRRVPNLKNIKKAFAGTNLSGPVYSRTSDYKESDTSTWGLFDYTKELAILEEAFSNTKIEAIDYDVFTPIKDVITNIDRCFQGCVDLASVRDSNASQFEEDWFPTETFFTQLSNLSNELGLPEEMFLGCTKIKMDITQKDGNTYLFHSNVKSEKAHVLKDTLYAGVKLRGYLGQNTFGGVSREIGNYYIPKFLTIESPFARCITGELTIKLSEVPKLFNSDSIVNLKNVFQGVSCVKGYDVIPNNLFSDCPNLENIQGLFSGMEITNNGEIYEFPNRDLFSNCSKLNNINGLFKNQRNLKIKLIGEGFTNCALQDVGEVFAGSGLFGVIPYKLWYMKNNKTIENMKNTFQDCVCLGYSEKRKIATNIKVSQDNYGNISYLDWKYGVPEVDKEGTRQFYVREQPEEFDLWQMDGRPWVKPDSMSDEEWSKYYDEYFKYDYWQKDAIQYRNSKNIKYVEEGFQNYIIPCDYFRYCSKTCKLEDSLNGINRRKTILIKDPDTGFYKVDTSNISDEIEGLVGRIPCKLFEELSDIESINGVFKNIHVAAYVNYRYSEDIKERGIKFPQDLFKHNNNVLNMIDIFKGMSFEVGVDINPDLFTYNTKLQNISGAFSECYFNDKLYLGSNTDDMQNQIPCTTLFANNPDIMNISQLFMCSSVKNNKIQGPLHMSSTIFTDKKAMRDISNCFANCSNMRGTVPEFYKENHQYLQMTSNYLYNCSKDLITNWDQVEWRPRE